MEVEVENGAFPTQLINANFLFCIKQDFLSFYFLGHSAEEVFKETVWGMGEMVDEAKYGLVLPSLIKANSDFDH